MKRIKMLVTVALLAGVSACASTQSSRGDAYADGSYYSAAGDGQGDYYYADERRGPDPWMTYGGFGSPFGFSGGYCSAQYRYCPSFWSFGFFDSGPFGYGYGPGGWYDPFWNGYYRPRHHHHGDHDAGTPGHSNDDQDVADNDSPTPVTGVADGNADGFVASEDADRAARRVDRPRRRASALALPGPAGSALRIRYPADLPQTRRAPERSAPPRRVEREIRPTSPRTRGGDGFGRAGRAATGGSEGRERARSPRSREDDDDDT